MTESDDTTRAGAPEIKRARGISAIWFIPLLAVALGGWLVYITLQQQGPTITLTFTTASGITAGKTQIKLRDVVVGTVSKVQLADDLKTVRVIADMVPEAESYLVTGTRFWIVQPEIGFEGVTGLSTLLSGAFIAVDPGSGNATREFKGFTRRPPVPPDAAGKRFMLSAERLGPLKVGSPVFFRNLRIGEVTGFQINARPELKDGELLCGEHGANLPQPFTIEIFVSAPFDPLVQQNSRFFNDSGATIDLSGRRVRLELRSISALLGGAIALETRSQARDAAEASACARYTLYEDLQKAEEASERHDRTPLLLYFSDSLAGLEVGSPVTFRGIVVGEVVDIDLSLDIERDTFTLPVRIDVYGGVIEVTGEDVEGLNSRERAEFLLERGLRAKLGTTNIITGALEVQLDFVPDAAPASIEFRNGIAVLPTVPSTLSQLEASVRTVLNNLEKLPLDKIGNELVGLIESARTLISSPELPQVIDELKGTAVAVRRLAEQVEQEAQPLLRDARRAVDSAGDTLATADSVAAEIGRATFEAETLMTELRAAARAIRLFAEYLERNPEALIQGRRGSR